MRDREAGMVFDWRRNHGSTRRLLIAALGFRCSNRPHFGESRLEAKYMARRASRQ